MFLNWCIKKDDLPANHRWLEADDALRPIIALQGLTGIRLQAAATAAVAECLWPGGTRRHFRDEIQDVPPSLGGNLSGSSSNCCANDSERWRTFFYRKAGRPELNQTAIRFPPVDRLALHKFAGRAASVFQRERRQKIFPTAIFLSMQWRNNATHAKVRHVFYRSRSRRPAAALRTA